MTASDDDARTPWWGSVTLDLDQTGRWNVGPCTLWLHRSDHEWRLVEHHAGDPMASDSRVTLPVADDEWAAVSDPEAPEAPDRSITRFGFRETTATADAHPLLGDRPFVVRPESTILVAPGERLTLYVSTPLWIRLTLSGATSSLHHDLPVLRPSDTWFGPSTREGTLCYAARTTGRIRLENLLQRMHRAVTPIAVHNQAADTLHIERIQIPVQHLALYASVYHFLWTQGIVLDRREDSEGADVRILDGPPDDATDPTRLAPPREEVKTSLAMSTFRAIGSLFST